MSEFKNPFDEYRPPRRNDCAAPKPPIGTTKLPFPFFEYDNSSAYSKPKQGEEQVIIVKYKKDKTIGANEDVVVELPNGTNKQDEVALCMAAAKILTGGFSNGFLVPEKVFTHLIGAMKDDLIALAASALFAKAIFGGESE